jgi:hypothetical protein
MHAHSPNKPKKFKQTLFACHRADGNSFLGQEGSDDGEFMQQASTIMSQVYCETLKKKGLAAEIQLGVV